MAAAASVLSKEETSGEATKSGLVEQYTNAVLGTYNDY